MINDKILEKINRLRKHKILYFTKIHVNAQRFGKVSWFKLDLFAQKKNIVSISTIHNLFDIKTISRNVQKRETNDLYIWPNIIHVKVQINNKAMLK